MLLDTGTQGYNKHLCASAQANDGFLQTGDAAAEHQFSQALPAPSPRVPEVCTRRHSRHRMRNTNCCSRQPGCCMCLRLPAPCKAQVLNPRAHWHGLVSGSSSNDTGTQGLQGTCSSGAKLGPDSCSFGKHYPAELVTSA